MILKNLMIVNENHRYEVNENIVMAPQEENIVIFSCGFCRVSIRGQTGNNSLRGLLRCRTDDLEFYEQGDSDYLIKNKVL